MLHTINITAFSFVSCSKTIAGISKVVIDTLVFFKAKIFWSVTSVIKIFYIRAVSLLFAIRIGVRTYLSMHPSCTFSCFVAIRGRIGIRSLFDFPELRTISLMQPTKDSIMYFTPCKRSSELNPRN